MLLQLHSCCICLNFGFIKNSICYFSLWRKKCLFITAMVLVFLEDIYLPCIHLDMKSTAFVVGTLLNTTNTARFSIVMFSWQILFSLLIHGLIYSRGLRSKLNGKKYSHTDFKNRCPITERKE